jgi:ubiquinone biosynthesis protein UbiJ
VQVADAVRAGLLKLREAARDFAETGAEFVTEETGDVVPRGEQAAFHDDVDGLRDDVERLAARVQRLRGAA